MNGLYVCMAIIEDNKNVVDITEVVYDNVFLVRCAVCELSKYCKNIFGEDA
jgi:hypothetical protein